jgi:hypothetical protein
MAKDPKTIYAIEIDGLPRSLLAIKESKSGHLTLTFRHGRFSDSVTGGRAELHNRHMSVHPATVGRAMTLTDKWEFTDGRKESIVSHVKPLEGHLLWLPLTARLGLLGEETGVFPVREKDHIVSVGRFNQSRATLFFAIMIADKIFKPEEFKIPSAAAFFKKFNRYSVGLICSYLNVPVVTDSRRIMITTSGPMVGSSPSLIRAKQQSMTPQTLSWHYTASIEALRVDYVSEAWRLVAEAQRKEANEEFDLPFFETMTTTFTPQPIIP